MMFTVLPKNRQKIASNLFHVNLRTVKPIIVESENIVNSNV